MKRRLLRAWCWLHDHRIVVETRIMVPGQSATLRTCRCGKNATGRVYRSQFPMRRSVA